MDSLPQEILSHVLKAARTDAKARSQAVALGRALVCRRWTEPALRALYGDVSITSTEELNGEFDSFGACLAARRYLALLVESLELRVHDKALADLEDASDEHDLAGLLTIVGQTCTRLRVLAISVSDGFDAWPSASCRAALEQLQLNTLRIRSRVRFGGGGLVDIATAICGGRSAASLRDITFLCEQSDPQAQRFDRPLTQLRRLAVRGVTIPRTGTGSLVAPALTDLDAGWAVVAALTHCALIRRLNTHLQSDAVDTARLAGFDSLQALFIGGRQPSIAFWRSAPPSVNSVSISFKTDDVGNLVDVLEGATALPRLVEISHPPSRSKSAHEALRAAAEARGITLRDLPISRRRT